MAVAAVAATLSAAAARGDEPTPAPEAAAFFEQKIRPLLVERCLKCHGAAGKPKGGLRLDTRRGWQQGGDAGPAVVPQKPEESLLVKAVRYADADLRMPPAGRLPEAEIALLEQWVRMGAPDPRGDSPIPATAANPAESAGHWAYQPLRPGSLPSVRTTGWPRDAVDHFVLRALEERGWSPSPDADRYTWLRRVTLDLTGLPPTPEEVAAFVNDRSEHAWESVVDRLLASPAYGERWARPWLDLVGYADQIGSANNVPAEHAWRYRDYVIRSVRDDKRFDRFALEQLAGDLLSAGSIEERQEQLTATGFLVLGNVNIVEADKLVMRMDIVDQQVEKVGKAFLGMTLNCVRCHDHKFDPITLADYYGLAGIFASTQSTYKTERGVWSSITKAPLPETLEQFTRREAARREHDRQVAQRRGELESAKSRLAEIESRVKQAKPGETTAAADAAETTRLEQESKQLSAQIKSLEQRLLHLDYVQPAPPLAFSVSDAPEIADTRAQVRGNPHVPGDVFPRGFVRVATHGPSPQVPADQSGRRELAEWLTTAARPLVSRVTVNRIWQGLFGRGIVASVDYFGVRGESPTHPELLDYLAAQFVEGGWSRKKLIRRLVLSRTYRQQSAADPANPALAADPDNRWHWRMSPRRLEAEMIRDAALAVCGDLRACDGGPALVPEFIENVGGLDPKDVNPISFSLKTFRDEQHHLRAIYLPVVRSSEQRGPSEVLNFFDFPQPARLAGDRATTAVASQSLFLLNGPLLADAARKLAANVVADSTLATDEQRFSHAYLRVIGRPPSAEVSAAAREFLWYDEAAASDPVRGWQRLIHALMASNEFLFRL